MAKDLSMTILFDFYGELLTKKQALALDYYYNQDLSLSEIAEPLGISRQGVRDFIKRGERQLLEFESKLGLAQRFALLKEDIDRVGRQVEALREYERTRLRSRDLADGLDKIEASLRRIAGDL